MRIDRYILDEHGEPKPEPDLMKWARWFETAERHVGNTTLPGGIRISTIFLDLDHSFSFTEDAKPMLWETIVFKPDRESMSMQRYRSRAAAIAGHIEAVAIYR